MRTMIRVMGLVSLLLAAALGFAQTEFSADIVNTSDAGSPVKAHIYFAKDKVRIEPTASNQRGPGGAVLMDLTTQTSAVIMDQQHMYMEMPAQVASQRVAYNFFRTGDADNACSDWAQQARNKGGTCHKVGTEVVNGRSAVKYEAADAGGKTGTFWIDPKLRFPVKWQSTNGSTGELRNIQEGTQPANLFEIPAGYQKFDMGGMMKNPK
jgi:hypothetical protein